MTSRARTTRGGLDALVCVAFATAICAPSLDWIRTGIPKSRRLPEERRSAPWPVAANWTELPGQFEAWFKDAVGLREPMLSLRSRFLVRGLGVSPTDTAVLGPRRWLFVTERRLLEVGRGADPLTRAELEAWQHSLEGRRDACARRGAAYVFALAPEKDAIYPEELPPEYVPLGPTRADQLFAHMRANSNVDVVDLRPVLRAERARDDGLDLTYFPYGPHWTDRGAEEAARVLLDRMSAVAPTVHRPEPIPTQWRATGQAGDDWAPRLYLDSLGEQIELVAGHAPRSGAHIVGAPETGQFTAVFESDAVQAPRLLFVHDSFGMYVRKFITGSFARSACYWDSELRPEMLAAEPADVILELFAERMLTTRPRAFGTAHLAQRFAESTRVVYTFDPARRDLRPVVEFADESRLEDGRLIVRSVASNPRVTLTAFPIPNDVVPMLRIEIDAARAGSLLVSYTTERQRTLSRQNSFRYSLEPGSNTVYAEVVGEEMRGPLVLVLPICPEPVSIRSIEARLVPR